MRTEIVTVTPNLAEEWLEHNTRTRRVSRAKVRQIRDDIEHDNWDLHHQGIGFYEDGVLADGQTRLTAIKEAGKPVPVMVTWGLPKEAGSSIDRHRPRSDADSIRIGGLAGWIGRDEVALIRMIASAHQKGTPTYSAKHLAELGEFLKGPVTFAMLVFSTRKRHITTGPVMAAVAIASQHVDQYRLMEFVEVLLSGVPESKDDIAAIRLREQLIGMQGRGGQMARRETLLKTMRAIRAFVERGHIKRLKAPNEMIYTIPGIEEHL